MDKKPHIAMLVAQSFQILNRYGKDSDALKDITRAFIEDLEPYSVEAITRAFKIWRRENAGMPTPANIIDILKSEHRDQHSRLKQFSDFNGDWPAYKRYLDQNNLLNPRVKHG